MTELHPDSHASSKLHSVVDRFNQTSRRELAFLDMAYDIENMGNLARAGNEDARKAIRPVLKRILLSCHPVSRNVRYIRDNLEDLAYTPDELDALTATRTRASEIREAVEVEIARGKDPWLTHVEHTEQNILNPFIVGFYQDPEGKIRELYGPRDFKSKRQIRDDNTPFQGRQENKEVNIVTAEFQQVHPSKILKSNYWSVLPEDLRSHFDNGEILLTGNQNLYELSDTDIHTLSYATDPFARNTLTEEKIRDAVTSGKNYFLHFYSDYGDDDSGRTGVIMQRDGDSIKPLVVSVNGREFVVEVKGCGKKSGGFGDMHDRTGRKIISGGAEAIQAETEFYRLQDSVREDAPKAVGSIIFENQDRFTGYQQGYIIRLTPSTLRASYTGIDTYPDIEKPEIVDRILHMYTEQLAEHIFSNPPKILDRSSHTENILLWGNGEHTWTDFSDHVAFADKNFPHTEEEGGYMTPKKMLDFYLTLVNQIPGYRSATDKQAFYDTLTEAFQNYGENLYLDISDDTKTVTQKIWESCMAYRVFRGRQEGKYIAEGVLQEYHKRSSPDYTKQFLKTDSQHSFIEQLTQGRKSLLTALSLFEQKLPGKIDEQILQEWRQAITHGPLSDVLRSVDLFDDAYSTNREALSEEERESIFAAMRYFGEFEHSLITPFQQYFEHELDVITAKAGNRAYARDQLTRAEEEVYERIQMFTHLMDTDISGFYSLLNDENQLKNLLSFSFYSQ